MPSRSPAPARRDQLPFAVHAHRRWFAPLLLACAILLLAVTPLPAARWVGTWATSPLAEEADTHKLAFTDATLRQVVRVSLGGDRMRVRFSNVFGRAPLSFHAAHVALAGADGTIDAASDRPLRFSGATAVTIPPGAVMMSDPLDFPLAPLTHVALTVHVAQVPPILTAHPGARATSYLQPGAVPAAPALPEATKFTRWYFINGIDVETADNARAIAILGDSITDGYGCVPDQNQRWPDELARRLQAQPDTAHLGVLNHGIGGNRLLRDGLGPNALARFERDVLAQTGVRWLIIFEGINDIGTRLNARKNGEPYASAVDIIAAYEQMIARARTHDLVVIGATITPYGGNASYWSADGEADRQTINHWIRTSGRFDAVIDFDALVRDPQQPDRLAAQYDSGDHLHPSTAAYKTMGASVDLKLFQP